MRSVTTDAAPAAIGPYSQGIVSGGLLFTSGQIPLDPASGAPEPGDFRAQVRRVLANLDAVLAAAGSGRDRVLKVTVFLTRMELFGELNEEYAAFFGDHRPARSVVEVARLPKDAVVEMELVAEAR
jgi:2-iminobutanoate/2-iminopropanoate deaminase